MSSEEAHPVQKDIISARQSPRDIHLKQIQKRNTNLHAQLAQLESHRLSLATELRTIIADAQPDNDVQAERERETETETEIEAETNANNNTNTNADNPASINTQEHENSNQGCQADMQATLATAQAIVQNHIRLLHDYNAIKDIGQGLFGLIADNRGLRLREIHEEFGVDDSD